MDKWTYANPFSFHSDQGFESRGTDIANRLTAWHNLLEETRPSGRLTSNPYERTLPRENVSCLYTTLVPTYDCVVFFIYFELKISFRCSSTNIQNKVKKLTTAIKNVN